MTTCLGKNCSLGLLGIFVNVCQLLCARLSFFVLRARVLSFLSFLFFAAKIYKKKNNPNRMEAKLRLDSCHIDKPILV